MQDTQTRNIGPLLDRVRRDVRAVKRQGRPPAWERLPLDGDAMLHHFNGGPAYGAAFIKPGESTTRLAVLDLDSHKGESTPEQMQAAAASLIDSAITKGILLHPFRSSGGNGIHLWAIWEGDQDARSVRAALADVLAACGFKNGTGGLAKGQIEIFPKQASVPPGGYGNMALLPGAFRSCPLDYFDLSPLDKFAPVVWQLSKPVPLLPTEPPRLAADSDVELTTFADALKFVPNDDDVNYEQWLAVLFSCHAIGAYEAALEWSQKSSKHTDAEFEKQWSFAKAGKAGGIGPGHVMRLARANGWREVSLDVIVEAFARAQSAIDDKAELLDEFGNEYPEPSDIWAGVTMRPLPLGILPKVIEHFAFDRAERAQRDPKGYALLAVGVLSGAVPLTTTVRPIAGYEWETSLIQWAMIAGESGLGKSPSFEDCVAPAVAHNARLIAANRIADAAYEAALAGVARGQPRPPAPLHRRRYANDVTIEKLVSLMNDDPTGITLGVDELSGWFNGFGQYKGGGGSDQATWLQAFNGKGAIIDRKGSGTHHVERFGVSIVGGIQPSALKKTAVDMTHDGMLPRFMVAALNKAHKLPKGPGIPGALTTYKKAAEALFDLPMMSMAFDPAAQVLVDEASDLAGQGAEVYKTSHPLTALHMEKARTHIARLAALFQLLEQIEQGQPVSDRIGTAAAQMAVDFYWWEVGQNFAVAEMMGCTSPGVDLAKEVGDYVLTHPATRITRRDLAKNCRAWRSADDKERKTALVFLRDMGFLVSGFNRVTGDRESPAYSEASAFVVNPRVYPAFADRARAEFTRRADIAGRIKGCTKHEKGNL